MLTDVIEKIDRQAEGRVIKIPQGDIDKCRDRINAEMEEVGRDWRYKNAESIKEAEKYYITF